MESKKTQNDNHIEQDTTIQNLYRYKTNFVIGTETNSPNKNTGFLNWICPLSISIRQSPVTETRGREEQKETDFTTRTDRGKTTNRFARGESLPVERGKTTE